MASNHRCNDANDVLEQVGIDSGSEIESESDESSLNGKYKGKMSTLKLIHSLLQLFYAALKFLYAVLDVLCATQMCLVHMEILFYLIWSFW